MTTDTGTTPPRSGYPARDARQLTRLLLDEPAVLEESIAESPTRGPARGADGRPPVSPPLVEELITR
ncbi:hypothetical protein [Streptomyces sp. NPDC005374]|uniref:hypothetical protein n=1 Tax=Streptomyces sp. NPDC005374 TaxID=3364713 RepID=UPI0036BEEBBD